VADEIEHPVTGLWRRNAPPSRLPRSVTLSAAAEGGGEGSQGGGPRLPLDQFRGVYSAKQQQAFQGFDTATSRGAKTMTWETPTFVEVKMDAEINSYQDDSGEDREPGF
jgi:hypothetical protein